MLSYNLFIGNFKTKWIDISWESQKCTDRRGRPRNTESALNRQNDNNDYTESLGTSPSSNAEKSPDTNQMLNELGLGHSNTENKSNDSNDTVNDQDNDMSTGQVSEINEF